MEQWASSTLRVLGVVIISGVVVIVALLTILFSICMFSGGNSPTGDAVPYVAGGCGIVVIGIIAIVRLARGLPRRNVSKER